jgi:hypothetical protein
MSCPNIGRTQAPHELYGDRRRGIPPATHGNGHATPPPAGAPLSAEVQEIHPL